jgi:predicted MPP superfamily phosphohydrolase
VTEHHKPSLTTRVKRAKARLRHAAFTKLPLHLSRGRLTQAASQSRLHLVERPVALQNLHPELRGLRITHLSDLHIGDLIPVARLPQIVATVNRLGSDMIAVTGDFVDLHLRVLDDVIDAMRQLEAPLGVYLVPGNHDYLHDATAFVRRMRDAGLTLLVNESRRIERGGASLQIAGIDYAHRRSSIRRDLRRTMTTLADQPSDLRMLLAHHPHAFDHAREHQVHLTLSGHTHGGQLKLPHNRRQSRSPLGLGHLSFRYPHGLYEREGSYLYVTSGVGSWFPLRVNCPAEIVQLTLHEKG